MGLAWQQGPLAAGSVGRFLTAQPLPDHMQRYTVAVAYHRTDIREAELKPVDGQTFCPCKGLADYYTVGENRLHAEPGQSVVPHGIDRGLDPDEILQNTAGQHG
jgi:hypothetical protein